MICTCGARAGDNPNCALHRDTMTDQRDTPDTRTPSAECRHNRHVRSGNDRRGYKPGRSLSEPCPEPVPLGDATTGAEPTEVHEVGCARKPHAGECFPVDIVVEDDAPAPTEALDDDRLPDAIKQALWERAPTACPDCGRRQIPQSWAVIVYERLAADLAAARAEIERWSGIADADSTELARQQREINAAEARADLAESRVAAVQALLHPLGAEGWDLIPDEFWIHERDIRAALDTASEDRGDSQGAALERDK